jgi:hypothetical protein
MTSIRTSESTNDSDLGAVDFSLRVGHVTFGSLHTLQVRDIAPLARRQLCVESSSS